ncbi:IS30 family transposase [Nocardioides islandensis]|uniref:IS30 family transposase n=1 Tax=Nocardioides islandensis TaxID=433663 RepID=UPI001E424D93|nr:IS30 family transposase [Nocardioides islandensis]
MAPAAFPREVRVAFWRGIAAGLSTEAAGRAVGVSRAVAFRWFAASGGVIPARLVRDSPAPLSSSRGRRLSAGDREEISHLTRCGQGVRQIAAAIGFDKSTVSRELRRNRSRGRYRGATAQRLAEARSRESRARQTKFAASPRLRAEVERRLEHNESPEQIAHRLPLDFPDDPEMRVSHETIYTSVYVQGRGALRKDLAGHLRTGRAMRKPRARARAATSGGPLRNVISISERPPCVEDRAVPGHWEGDLIMGAANASAIGTLVERATGFLGLLHLPGDHTALTMQGAICEYMATLPATLRQTLTWDRGSEMANHIQIAGATGLDIYFADPASPWQRGSNENTNGLLRQYFPKGTDLSLWGPGYLDQVALEMNNRPRKRLGWRTPAEALDQLLCGHDKPPGVALTG